MTRTASRRCFVGWAGSTPQPPMTPTARTPVWPAPRPLWTLGDWRPDEIRVVTDPELATRAAFLGPCLATEDELHHALHAAAIGKHREVLQGLPGSYAVVVDDGHRVHVLTDRAGLHPVFHTQLGAGTVYASDALILAALQHPNLAEAVNPTALAAAMFLPELPQPFGPASVFTGVQRVGPDHALVLTPHRHPQVQPLWTDTGSTDLVDAGTLLRQALLTAVDRRVSVATTVSTDLSGGLDSSCLAVLAAHAGSVPLAVTYADPYAVNDEDLHFARTIAATQPRLHHVVMTGDQGTLPFTAMDTVPVTDEPSLDGVIIARTRHRLAPALAHRSELHLTGDGGDVVLTAPGLTYLGDLARTRQRRALRQEATGWARLRHHPARRVVAAANGLARTSWSDTLGQLAGQLTDPHLHSPARRGLQDHLAWATLSPATAWGTLRIRSAVAGRLRATAPSPHAHGVRPDSADAVALRTLHWHGAATRGFTQITRALGITVATPFLDNQVIDACLAAPAVERTTVTHAKPLLAAALGGRVPAGLLARRTKGDYSACEYHGLRANADELRALLAQPLLADLDVLTPEGPREALRLGLAGMPAPMGALGVVLATETWLRALTTLDPTRWWRPTTTEEDTP
ncbi:albusnodin/ikarugamycin family macrolactam cyclase [Kutzneria sp. NPDC051319]|uniref:albusnodin/ikarugamycin family macrolactam cyclase n=1 Tax=Kutzneria sp. NPDC051319 TaxID=3155047 RepID=UPI003445CF75